MSPNTFVSAGNRCRDRANFFGIGPARQAHAADGRRSSTMPTWRLSNVQLVAAAVPEIRGLWRRGRRGAWHCCLRACRRWDLVRPAGARCVPLARDDQLGERQEQRQKFTSAKRPRDRLHRRRFASNWAGMRSVGILRGAYHFGRPSRSGRARITLNVIQPAPAIALDPRPRATDE